MSDSPTRRGLFVSGDLMLGTAVIGAMSTVCGDVSRALSGRGLLDKLTSQPVDLLVVDLEAEDLDLPGIGAIARETGRPLVIAYAPHVAVDRMQAARAAGFAAVLTRGQAASQLAAVLAQVFPPPG